uniref:BED-type domain-containing protein n=1 Tax=Trichuris muris TaxID=70415 RepID=A0A5S6QJ57_TRIMR
MTNKRTNCKSAQTDSLQRYQVDAYVDDASHSRLCLTLSKQSASRCSLEKKLCLCRSSFANAWSERRKQCSFPPFLFCIRSPVAHSVFVFGFWHIPFHLHLSCWTYRKGSYTQPESKRKYKQYSSDYLNRVFSNESMKPSRLKKHLAKVHPDKAGKEFNYFKSLCEKFGERSTLSSMFSSRTALQMVGLRASFNISLMIARSGEAHTIGEEFFLL